MYRRYEDPYKLEQELEQATHELWIAVKEGEEDTSDLEQWIAELKDRINFAWQDDEFDCEVLS